ncbi:MAG TPA: hypothetical protein VKH42_07200 [Vicinamibacterales bacterium]|nr:hypothetical protein [Vicinamibacterales bacterium]
MKATVFVGTSLDGFIARLDGSLDFLPPGGGEPHGYDEFMSTVDALVIGRNTFETVLTFDAWPYGEKPVFVLSTRPLASAPPGAAVVCREIRPTSSRSLRRVASAIFTSMAGSRFSGFFRQGSFNGSLLPASRC